MSLSKLPKFYLNHPPEGSCEVLSSFCNRCRRQESSQKPPGPSEPNSTRMFIRWYFGLLVHHESHINQKGGKCYGNYISLRTQQWKKTSYYFSTMSTPCVIYFSRVTFRQSCFQSLTPIVHREDASWLHCYEILHMHEGIHYLSSLKVQYN